MFELLGASEGKIYRNVKGFYVYFPASGRYKFLPQKYTDEKIRLLALLHKQTLKTGEKSSAYSAIRDPIALCASGCCYKGGPA